MALKSLEADDILKKLLLMQTARMTLCFLQVHILKAYLAHIALSRYQEELVTILIKIK